MWNLRICKRNRYTGKKFLVKSLLSNNLFSHLLTKRLRTTLERSFENAMVVVTAVLQGGVLMVLFV